MCFFNLNFKSIKIKNTTHTTLSWKRNRFLAWINERQSGRSSFLRRRCSGFLNWAQDEELDVKLLHGSIIVSSDFRCLVFHCKNHLIWYLLKILGLLLGLYIAMDQLQFDISNTVKVDQLYKLDLNAPPKCSRTTETNQPFVVSQSKKMKKNFLN